MIPVVALVGRPNVGKSTLFNAMTRTRDALVADRPGVTRDRHYGVCRTQARHFVVVDTGGLTGEVDDLSGLAAQQAWAAIDESALVLFVVDAREGLLPGDRTILDALRRHGKAPLLVVNKCDGLDEHAALADFSALGVTPMLALAAAHQRGVPGLIDAVLARLPEAPATSDQADDGSVRVAIVGRPNVGKSTLVNRLLGEERMIASDVPGTTRDAIEVALEREGKRYTLIDTAGVRRRARVEDAVEKFSIIKTLQALDEAHVVVVMIDAAQGVTEQDATVLGHAIEAGRALVIAVNKWDGLDKYARERCMAELDRRLDYAAYALRVVISAKHGTGMRELMKAIDRAYHATARELPTKELTAALEMAYESYQPPLVRGRVAKLRYAHMGGRLPPCVVIHGSRVSTLPDSYKRYLENFLRKRFRLDGTPIRLEFRDGENPYEGKRNELSDRQVKKRQRLRRFVKRRG
jgi:GTP-binding protein